MKNYRIRFRLWHLFVLFSLMIVAVGIYTESCMKTALIEIEEFDVETTNGSQHEVFKIRYKFLRPKTRLKSAVHVFLSNPVSVKRSFDVGNQISFRYLEQPILWLKPTDPNLIAIRKLGVKHTDVDETITEMVY
ncbi:MAG: hypothetical protein AB8B55_14810 [Mariniblastus sp.]